MNFYQSQSAKLQQHTLNTSHAHNTESPVTQNPDSNLPTYLQPHYYEILFSLDFKDSCVNEIASQIIADIILEHGEGVEFLSKDMIDVGMFYKS